jgi:hypothetical protein
MITNRDLIIIFGGILFIYLAVLVERFVRGSDDHKRKALKYSVVWLVIFVFFEFSVWLQSAI